MLDSRIHTFLKLCEVGNYRITAEVLSMTQPAVTQHIHFLEQQYGCKLFEYKDRKLHKTEECLKLERHALSVVYNEEVFKNEIKKSPVRKISIGATKTVGEYLIEEKAARLLSRSDLECSFIVDNTRHLFAALNALRLDILMIEGYFDKAEYGYRLIKEEEIIGICGKNHPFAGRVVSIEELFLQHIILREEGSGTRNVFESFLKGKNLSCKLFARQSVVSSFGIICAAVAKGVGVSFVYESIPKTAKNLSTFKIENASIKHEFNYVYLKNADIGDLIDLIDNP